MAISRKNRRSITVGESKYVWYVAPDEEAFGAPALTVISADRTFFVRYQLSQSHEARYVTVLGSRFRNLRTGGPWRRFRCPSFGAVDSVTPRDVRGLIEWSLETTGEAPAEVDWQGHALSSKTEAV